MSIIPEAVRALWNPAIASDRRQRFEAESKARRVEAEAELTQVEKYAEAQKAKANTKPGAIKGHFGKYGKRYAFGALAAAGVAGLIALIQKLRNPQGRDQLHEVATAAQAVVPF